MVRTTDRFNEFVITKADGTEIVGRVVGEEGRDVPQFAVQSLSISR